MLDVLADLCGSARIKTFYMVNQTERKNNAKISRLKAKKKATSPEKKRIVIRKDNDGNPIKRVTRQDAYIRTANEIFGLVLTRENEDETATLLVAKAYLMGAPTYNGLITGGLMPKKGETK